MLDALLARGLPFVAGLLFTLLLLGGSIWAIRRLGIGRSRRGNNERRKQPRLAVIEAAAVDGRRWLILIRRDNVAHLLMIGGPTDVVIAPNIVRAAVATREWPAQLRAPATTDTLPRAVPFGDAGMWPLQAEPDRVPRPQRSPAPEEPVQWSVEPELPAPRRQSRPIDPFAGLTAEVARLPEPTRTPSDLGGPDGFLPRAPMHEREPVLREREPAQMREPQPPPVVAEPEINASVDQNLADMMHRLEAALSRPAETKTARSAESTPRPMAAELISALPARPRAAAPTSAARAALSEPKPSMSIWDNLEQEMASVLGTPTLIEDPETSITAARKAMLRAIEEQPSPSPSVLNSDSVDVGAYAPESAQPGSVALVQLILYPSSQSRGARRKAQEADPDATRRGAVTLSVNIEVGQSVSVILEGDGLSIEEPATSFIWRNAIRACQFRVTLPKESVGIIYQLRGRVLLESVPIGTLCFTLRGIASDSIPANPTMRGDSAKRYGHAFLSYATADRAEVLKRAQALKAAHIGFFEDLLHLEPGERWQRRLFEEIDRCDLFLLFWSSDAARSEWVLREAEYALNRSKLSRDQMPDITPIILEGPPMPPPPEQLKEIHFNDALRYMISAVEFGA